MGVAVCIYGPTGVGKTECAEILATAISGEIINFDAAQFYTALSVGTAKPDITHTSVPYHMIDYCDEPKDFSVSAYRAVVTSLVTDIQKRGKIPIFVGGSGFYMSSLFFALHAQPEKTDTVSIAEDQSLWDQLNAVDPVRAAQLHPHDTYRLTRALTLYQQNNALPSALKPTYCPITCFIVITLTRDKNELKERIRERIVTMLKTGWIEEVEAILDTPWESFLLKKKWIGYPEVIHFCREGKDAAAMPPLIDLLWRTTWRYARKQMAYARMVVKQLIAAGHTIPIIPIDLTSCTIELYLKQLKSDIQSLQKGACNE